jgi:t-SNARE complex subunit (syntaxin)
MIPCTTAHREKEKKMAEPEETRQEQETRWTAQRAARDEEFQAVQKARQRTTRRTWVIVAVIVIIIVVIAVVLL